MLAAALSQITGQQIGKRIGHAQHRAGRTSGNGYRTTRLIELARTGHGTVFLPAAEE